MKHYPHHIGDFDRATRHLTRLERSVYRDLMDLYYDTEQRLTLDMAVLCRRIIARSSSEAKAVQQVLQEFFTQTPTGWYHDRCEQEIAAYHANSSQRAIAGKASAEAKRLSKLQAMSPEAAQAEQAPSEEPAQAEQDQNDKPAGEQQTVNEKSTSVEHPLNPVATDAQRNSTNQSTNQPINQEPKEGETPRKRSAAIPPAPSIAQPDDVDRQTWADWLALRKAKRAPVTETVVAGARSEAGKAGMSLEAFLQAWCRRGSQGLEADWLKPHERLPDRVAPGQPNKPSRHNGFHNLNYREGIAEDGTFV